MKNNIILEIFKKTEKIVNSRNMQKINNILLITNGPKNEAKLEKYFQMNENKNKMFQNLHEVVKPVLEGKNVFIHFYIKMNKYLKIIT